MIALGFGLGVSLMLLVAAIIYAVRVVEERDRLRNELTLLKQRDGEATGRD